MGRSQAPSNPSANMTNSHPPTSPTSPVTKIHPEFFLEGCDQLLLVQLPTPTYFRVPSYILRGSKFYEIKAAPDTASAPVPGAERAIIIDEATVDEMASFFRIFLNPRLLPRSLIDDYSGVSLDEWFSNLRLSHMWGFTYVKQMSLRYIRPKIEQAIPSLVERIVKYEEYSPPAETLVPLYVELCTRDAQLSDPEWELLEPLPQKRLRRVTTLREKIANLKGAGGLPSAAKLEKNIGEALGLITRTTNASFSAGSTSQPNGGSARAPNATTNASTATTTANGTTGITGAVDIKQSAEGSQGAHSGMPTLISLILSLHLVLFWNLM
ncbi:hypothetical protein NMY22_g5639 [Coprinellus aureogranulatus]|nr:hypothetical protein NMY22_g5639 [Coprinellus aureogranulatus]